MSKPISISFGKPKSSNTSKPPSSSSSFARPSPSVSASNPTPLRNSVFAPRSTRRHDSDDEEDAAEPVHQSIHGFASDGAILAETVQKEPKHVIVNKGNEEWLARLKVAQTPSNRDDQHQQANGSGGGLGDGLVERDEVSKASGLQFAEPTTDRDHPAQNGNGASGNESSEPLPVKERTEDEIALEALLSSGTGERKSTAVIIPTETEPMSRAGFVDEADRFRADVASRPDSATLDEYAAMPVEEFGAALLRNMGKKRKANGQMPNYGGDQSTASTAPKIREPRQGYLGIGAKAAPGAEIELGAWGKAAMRKNKKGEGLYTPVMLRDKRTGEMLTEEELEVRKKEAQGKANGSSKGEKDWRDRRDRNLERNGRDDHRDQEQNGFSRGTLSLKEREDHESSRSGSSRRDRSRSRDRRRKDENGRDEKHRDREDKYRDRDRDRDKDRDRRRDRVRDDDRYDSSSSRNSRDSHRNRDRDRERDRDGGRERSHREDARR